MRPPSILLLILSLCIPLSCDKSSSGTEARIDELLSESRLRFRSQRLDPAMEKAIAAYDLAREKGLSAKEAQCLVKIAQIDIAAVRDAQAWEHALEAEDISRRLGLDTLLSSALIIKGKVCSYAHIYEQDSRDDEAIPYLEEALALAHNAGNPALEAESYLILSEIFVNKNRWNDPLDMEMYRKAGDLLQSGSDIVEREDLTYFKDRVLRYWIRYYRQGGQYQRSIELCNRILAESDPTETYLRAQIHDQLAALYDQVDENDKVFSEHQEYSLAIQSYLREKAEEEIQEMETLYKTALKEKALNQKKNQIAILLLSLLALGLVLALVWRRSEKAQRRSQELEKTSQDKDQMLAYISEDLVSPTEDSPSKTEALAELAKACSSMDRYEVIKKCQELVKGSDELNESIANYILSIAARKKKASSELGITDREVEIIRMSARGFTATQIAEKLYISPRTVNNHRQNIYTKMKVKNNAQMIQKAKEMGML